VSVVVEETGLLLIQTPRLSTDAMRRCFLSRESIPKIMN
jgi:hypothetical protein